MSPVDRSSGVRSDHTVILTANESAKVYPDVATTCWLRSFGSACGWK
jgi:hypothetical protein